MAKQHPSRTDRQRALREDVRFRLLRALDADPDLSQRGLARETGVSLGAVNALLNGLIEAGWVKIGSAEAAPARFRIAYLPTEAGRAEAQRLAGRYLARRQAERAALSAEIATLEADDRSGANSRG